MDVKLTWTPGEGANSQTVQYRVQGTSTWTTYSTINNGTTSQLVVTLSDGSYNFRILTYCINCNCPLGQVLNADGYCVFIDTIPATQSGTSIAITQTPYLVYGNLGTRIYTSTTVNGTNTLLDVNNPFWIRQDVPGFNTMTADQKQTADLNNGPVNRLSVWGLNTIGGVVQNNYNYTTSSITPTGTWIGFDVCINVPQSKKYYIAIAADNYYRFFIDDVVILSDEIGHTTVFNYLHVYPVQIKAGSHIIKLEGFNVEERAGLACEIYDFGTMTHSEVVAFLNAQTSYTNINVVFTTRGLTAFTSNLFTCPSGYEQLKPNCTNVVCTKTTLTSCSTLPIASGIISIDYTPGDDGTVIIENLAGTGGTSYASATIDDISPSWFIASSGDFPISSGATIVGTHVSFSGSFTVTVSNVGFGCCLVLYKNNSVYMSVTVNSSDVYTFNSVNFATSDAVKLTLQSIPC